MPSVSFQAKEFMLVQARQEPVLGVKQEGFKNPTTQRGPFRQILDPKPNIDIKSWVEIQMDGTAFVLHFE